MKKIILALLLATGLSSVHAQQISPAVVNSGGSSNTTGSLIIDWSMGEGFVQTSLGPTVLTAGVLQPLLTSEMSPLPVTGLLFNAKRSSPDRVQLDWRTIQEFNNRGFYIERKKDNEASYTTIAFVQSRASNGNSSTPLEYNWTDSNSHTGTTFYRLKQTDIDGRSIYSVIRMVKSGDTRAITLKTWPNPAQADIQVMLHGKGKEILQVFDLAGRITQQISVTENVSVTIKHLPAGTYIIRLAGDPQISEKIIFQ